MNQQVPIQRSSSFYERTKQDAFDSDTGERGVTFDKVLEASVTDTEPLLTHQEEEYSYAYLWFVYLYDQYDYFILGSCSKKRTDYGEVKAESVEALNSLYEDLF